MFASHALTACRSICIPSMFVPYTGQSAGGIYGLVALSPSVGTYAGGRFTSHVPIRVVQPATHPNNSLNLKTEDNRNPIIKQEGELRRRQRQASIPAVTTSYRADVGAWQGSLRVTVCWRELLYTKINCKNSRG